MPLALRPLVLWSILIVLAIGSAAAQTPTPEQRKEANVRLQKCRGNLRSIAPLKDYQGREHTAEQWANALKAGKVAEANLRILEKEISHECTCLVLKAVNHYELVKKLSRGCTDADLYGPPPSPPTPTESSYYWDPAGTGNCAGHDIDNGTDGPTPELGYCGRTSFQMIAVCWDGTFRNALQPDRKWCTYKSVPYQVCLNEFATFSADKARAVQQSIGKVYVCRYRR